MSNRVVVGLTGRTGTGKTTVARHLKDKWGFQVLEGSEVLRAAAADDGVILSSRDSYSRYYREQQRKRGIDFLARITLASDAERVVHCGLRSSADQSLIKQVGGIVIALVCPPEVCVPRIDTANPKNPSTLGEYARQQALQDSGIYGLDLAGVIDSADYVVGTDCEPEVTFADVDVIIGSLVERE